MLSQYQRIAAEQKNKQLIEEIKRKRAEFAGVGTNKAKRRLNKLSLVSPIAKAARLAIEIEDKSISAKDSYGKYKERIYNQKTKLILCLCEFFKEQNWIYGVQDSDVFAATHIIYFEIPGCEQISWHFSPEDKDLIFPEYTKDWDKKINSTMSKLEVLTNQLIN